MTVIAILIPVFICKRNWRAEQEPLLVAIFSSDCKTQPQYPVAASVEKREREITDDIFLI